MGVTLDDRDQKILTLLRADAWLSYTVLSRRVNLSASAVQRRVERMIRAGIILGARAEVKRFCGRVADHPAVVEAHYVAGEADVLLKLCLPNMAAYDRFVEKHLNASGLVRKFKTFTALRSLAPARVG
jgi:Lrp/AsnC family transcriptional regulator, leucine-responsive regulatory protein